MLNQTIDHAKIMTIERHILEEQHSHPEATGMAAITRARCLLQMGLVRENANRWNSAGSSMVDVWTLSGFRFYIPTIRM